MRRGLGQGGGPQGFELLAHLGGKAGDRRVGEVGRDAHALLLAEGDDVGLLAVDVGGIAGVDLELGRNGGLDRADLRPDRAQPGQVDAGKRQQLEGSAAAAVLVDVEAVAGGLVGGQRQALEQPAAVRQRAASCAAKAARRSAPTQPSSSPTGVSR